MSRQRTALQRVAKRFNLNIVRIVELIGVSGTATLEYEDVQKILAEIRQPGIRGLVVSALDRLFRPGKRLGQFAIVDPFMEENKVIYTEREGECDPNTEEGYNKIVHGGGAAGAEWRKIQSLSRDGKTEKAQQGRIVNPANAKVYGYRYVPKRPWNAQTQDLRMEYLDDELEISGKVPVFDASTETTTSGKKKCHSRMSSNVPCHRQVGNS